MASHLDLEYGDWDFSRKVNKESGDLFSPRLGEPQLQVNRLFKTGVARAGETMSFERDVAVEDAPQLKSIKSGSNDLLQVFVVRQERSWTPLDISRELFEDFVSIFTVFSPIWRCIFTFGCKFEEHECEFPGFMSRGPSRLLRKDSLESVYVIRRAELNHRKQSKGSIPWSIRQSAVYHRYGSQQGALQDAPLPQTSLSNLRSTFLLICPSKSMDRKIERLLEIALSNEIAIAPYNLHSLIVADSMKGWLDYISWLEQDIKTHSDRITFAALGPEKKESKDSFKFSVGDRQSLKAKEDMVIDLQIVLSTLLSTIQGIRKYCERCCELSCRREDEDDCACGSALEEFSDYITEVELCKERARILKDRVVSTSQLLSDLLRYEDQEALKELTKQSQDENHMMRSLTEKSTKDAEAVKVLTIIGLVYLPTTFVANFFSTEFVQTDENGNMSVSANTWWLCVRYRSSPVPRKPLKCYNENVGGGGWASWGRVRKNKPRMRDTEDPEILTTTPGSVSEGTWSTTATTMKDD